jgi:hypothetical protein
VSGIHPCHSKSVFEVHNVVASVLFLEVSVFKLHDPDFAKRLDEFRGADPTDLGDEIALCRVLAEAATNEGHIALSGHLLHIVGKLELLQIQQREKMGNLLDRHALFSAGAAICEAIAARLSGRPDYGELVDLILPAITDTLKTVGREQKHEPLLLTREKTP